MLKRVTFIAGLAGLLAACGGADPTPEAAGGPASESSSAASAAADTDACKLVSPEEMGEIFAARSFVIDRSSPQPPVQPGGANRNTITSCTFVSEGASVQDMMSVTVLVTIAPSDEAQQSIESMKAGVLSLGLGAEPADIPGLGDGAYWVNLGARRSAVAVNVKHDPRIWLSISESSLGQEVPVTVERLTRVARGVLARL